MLFTPTSPASGVLNYETQHKEGTCKVSKISVKVSAFYAVFLSLFQISDYHHLKQSNNLNVTTVFEPSGLLLTVRRRYFCCDSSVLYVMSVCIWSSAIWSVE